MRSAVVLLPPCVLAALAVPVAAQLMEPLPAPPPAPLREYAWTEAFPITPPFAEWTEAGNTLDQRTRIWLHSDSVNWRRDRWLSVDALTYSNAAAGGGDYARLLVTLSCDSQRLLQVVAEAAVIIDPEGLIRPTSKIREGSVARADQLPDSLYDMLCFDAARRAPFMAG